MWKSLPLSGMIKQTNGNSEVYDSLLEYYSCNCSIRRVCGNTGHHLVVINTCVYKVMFYYASRENGKCFGVEKEDLIRQPVVGSCR